MWKKLSLYLLMVVLIFMYAIPKMSYASTTNNQSTPNASTNSFEPVAVKGKVHGTTRLRVDVNNSTEHIGIKISNVSMAPPAKGDPAPTGGTVTNPYNPGTDISGVDAKINKYLGVYLLDKNNKIVQFKQIPLSAHQIQAEKWSLEWQDNFNGNSIDKSKWNFVTGGGGFGNNELETYTNQPQNARVEDGHLVIQAHKDANGNYTSAKLTTQNKGDWTYGRYVIRAKLPQGQGMWPAIWMMPSDYNLYTGWPACGEIDIMELLGNDPSTVYGTLHYGLPWTHTGTSYTLPNNASFSNSYHTFTLDWEPGEMRWYVDGVLYQKQNNWFSQDANAAAPFTYPAPFDRNFYLQLNLAVGGNWPGNPDSTTKFPQQMDVDYVKVYKLDGQYREAGPAPANTSSTTNTSMRQPTSDGNYIYNGTFDTNTTNWQFQPAGDANGVQFGGSGSIAIDNGALKTTITQPGNANYAVQLVQGNLPLEKGSSYKLSFDAWSSGNRTMVTDISGPDKSFARYLQDQTQNLTSSKQHFEYTFKMANDTDPNARVEFNMGGGSTLPVWLDNVRLEKLPKDPNAPRDVLPDGNYIYNGTFDEGNNRQIFWNLSTDKDAHAIATVGSAIPDRELKMSIKNPGKQVNSIRYGQNSLNIEKGKSYLLTFDAHSDSKRTINVNVTNADRSTTYATSPSFNLNQKTQSYSWVFQMNNKTDVHSMLQFLLGKYKATTYIDNVVLKTIAPPQTISNYGLIQAESFQSMSGVQLATDKSSVGWIDPGDWMQYAVNVKQAGDYKVSYNVACGRDGGHIDLLDKAGNIYNGTLSQGEIQKSDADSISSMDVAQTGGWGTWKTVSATQTIHLEKGIQTLQIYAPNVNLDWIDLSLSSLSNNVQLKNGLFNTDTSNWNLWTGDQWNGYADSNMFVNASNQLDVQVNKVGNVSFSPQVYQEGLTFVPGQTYKVSFDAKASGGKAINVNIGKALTTNPYFINYAPTQRINLTPDMKTYTFTFTMEQPTYDNGKIVFEVGNVVKGDSSYSGNIIFDNISIEPVNS